MQELDANRADSSQRVVDLAVDLAQDGAPEAAVDRAVTELGHLEILVCNHARSGGDGALGDLAAEMLDAHWAVNARSSLLLVQAFTAQHDGRPGGRVVLMTSGQGLGPMPGEVAYVASKAALAGVTVTLADQLADVGPLDDGAGAQHRRWVRAGVLLLTVGRRKPEAYLCAAP